MRYALALSPDEHREERPRTREAARSFVRTEGARASRACSYAAGVSAETTGFHHLCLHTLGPPPGGCGPAHLPGNRSSTDPAIVVVARTDPNEQESVVVLPELDAVPDRGRGTQP